MQQPGVNASAISGSKESSGHADAHKSKQEPPSGSSNPLAKPGEMQYNLVLGKFTLETLSFRLQNSKRFYINYQKSKCYYIIIR